MSPGGGGTRGLSQSAGLAQVRPAGRQTLISFLIFPWHTGGHNWANPAQEGLSSPNKERPELCPAMVPWLLVLPVTRCTHQHLAALGWASWRGWPQIWCPKHLPQLLPSKASSSCKIHIWGHLGSINLLVCFNSRVDTSLRDYISILYLIKGRCVLSINPISSLD